MIHEPRAETSSLVCSRRTHHGAPVADETKARTRRIQCARGSGRRAIIAGRFRGLLGLRGEREGLGKPHHEPAGLVQGLGPLEGVRIRAPDAQALEIPGVELARVARSTWA